MCLYGRHGHSGGCSYIRYIHFCDEAHQEYAALLRGKLLKRLVDHFHSFFGDQLDFGRALSAHQMLAQIVGIDRSCGSRLPETKFLALSVIANQIEGDPHQPCAYAAIASKLISGEMSFEKAILGNGLSSIAVCNRESHKTEHLRLVQPDQAINIVQL